MIAIPYSIVDSSILSFDSQIINFNTQIVINLKKMLSDRRMKLSSKRQYVKTLITLSKDIITAKPDMLAKYQEVFDKIISPDLMESQPFENFRNRLIKELGYAARRSDFYPKFF